MGKVKIKLEDNTKLEELAQEIYNDYNSQMNLINNKMNELVNSTNLQGDVSIYDKTTLTNAVANLIKLKDATIKGKLELSKMMKEMSKKGDDLEKKEPTVSKSKFSFDEMNKFIQQNKKTGENKEDNYKI